MDLSPPLRVDKLKFVLALGPWPDDGSSMGGSRRAMRSPGAQNKAHRYVLYFIFQQLILNRDFHLHSELKNSENGGLSIFWTGLGLVCLALEVLASSVARWHLAWCQRFLGHSYSRMPVCAAVKIRSIPLCWFGSWQTMVSSCPPAAVLSVPRVPANPCTAGPCLTLYVSQAVWSLTSKLRPPGASLSSQYRPVRGTENPENLSPLGYGPSQSEHTD